MTANIVICHVVPESNSILYRIIPSTNLCHKRILLHQRDALLRPRETRLTKVLLAVHHTYLLNETTCALAVHCWQCV